jgi:hypothetical protein
VAEAEFWVFDSLNKLREETDDRFHQRDGSAGSADTCAAMDDAAFVSSRFQVPLDEVIDHLLEIKHCLVFRDSVIRPASKVDLVHFLCGSVWLESVHLSPV